VCLINISYRACDDDGACVNASLPIVARMDSDDQSDDLLAILISVGSVLGALVLGILGFLIRRWVAHYRKALAAQRKQRELKLERIQKAANTVTTCGFSVCLMRYESFVRNGRLVTYEEALAAGDLVVLQVYDDVLAFVSVYPTVFFSHQCVLCSALLFHCAGTIPASERSYL
jgi:uncharacterized membrane protein YciS (DUF1049 family)